jgi:hypothetical protein
MQGSVEVIWEPISSRHRFGGDLGPSAQDAGVKVTWRPAAQDRGVRMTWGPSSPVFRGQGGLGLD